jgi:hypothetical protein
LGGGITNQKSKAINMEKFFGQIKTAIPKEMQGVQTFAPIPQPPIEGVKVSDGNNNVFSDKDGKYEITTDKQFLTFSKDGYEIKTKNLYPTITGVRSNKKDVWLQKSGNTTTETKSNSEDKKTSPFVWVAIGIAVVGLGWWYYKSKKK